MGALEAFFASNNNETPKRLLSVACFACFFVADTGMAVLAPNLAEHAAAQCAVLSDPESWPDL